MSLCGLLPLGLLLPLCGLLALGLLLALPLRGLGLRLHELGVVDVAVAVLVVLLQDGVNHLYELLVSEHLVLAVLVRRVVPLLRERRLCYS